MDIVVFTSSTVTSLHFILKELAVSVLVDMTDMAIHLQCFIVSHLCAIFLHSAPLLYT